MAKNKKRKTRAPINLVGPTPEIEARGAERVGMATRRIPVIETMHRRAQLNEEQFRRLMKFRDTLIMAERTPVKSCLNDNPGGNGNGPSVATISAIIQAGWWERDMPGNAWEVAVAVCRDDKSLSEYCVEKYGGRERYDKNGGFIALVPVGEKTRVARALLDLRFASGFIVT
jgi:hypothetical protein